MFKPFKYTLGFIFYFSIHLNTLAIESTPQQLDKGAMQLVGKAQFSVLFWDIYESNLYTASGEFEGITPPLVFEINYQRNISKQELIERTREQWQELGLLITQYEHFISPLNSLWPDIKQGDTLAIKVAKDHSLFYFNNVYIGKIEDEKFAMIFLDIWLSKNTSQPKLRNQLLGYK